MIRSALLSVVNILVVTEGEQSCMVLLIVNTHFVCNTSTNS